MSWIDISIPVRNGMVHWPGDPGFQSRLHKTIGDANGSPCNLTHMSLSAHTRRIFPQSWLLRGLHSPRRLQSWL